MPNSRNESMSDMPITMSALRSGMLLSPIRKVLLFSFMALRPRHASTPTMVDMTAAQKAMVRVLPRASIIISLSNISLYQSREKPTQAFIDFPLLKERTIRVPMGRYRNMTIRARYMAFKAFFISHYPPRSCQIFQ